MLGTSLDPPLLTAWYPYVPNLLAAVHVWLPLDSATYNCIHRSVHHASIQLDDLLNRVKLLKADRIGSYFGRCIKPLLNAIDKATNFSESVDRVLVMEAMLAIFP